MGGAISRPRGPEGSRGGASAPGRPPHPADEHRPSSRSPARRPLAAMRVKTDAPELAILHAWLDSWSGLGLVVVGMQRHGYDLSLTHDRSGWRATFLHRSHVLYPWVGQVLTWWPTSWRAGRKQAVRRWHRASG